MQKTENFGFNKPEPSDLANVAVLNENFDIADRELKKAGGTYDLDLREYVTVLYPGENETEQTFTVTENVDVAALMAAIDAGRTVKVRCTLESDVILFGKHHVGVVMTEEAAAASAEPGARVLSGIGLDMLYAAGDRFNYHYFRLYVGTDDNGEQYVTFSFTPAVIEKSGQQESRPAITAISVTESADGTVTMVNTLEGGGTETLVLTPDASGNPATLTYNGTVIPITWTEAGAAAEENSEVEVTEE